MVPGPQSTFPKVRASPSPAQPLATVTLQPGSGKLYPTGMQQTDWVLAPTLTQPPVLQKEARHKAEQPLPDRLSSATTAHTYPLESYPLFLVIPSPYLVCSLSGQHSHPPTLSLISYSIIPSFSYLGQVIF